jgi:hypothetical protein
MLRPVYDRRLDVLKRGTSGKFDTVVDGLANVPCTFGGREVFASAGGSAGGSGRADTLVQFTLAWDADVKINENARIRFSQKRVAGKWVRLTSEPTYVLVEGTIVAPEVNGIVSHNQAAIVREGG